MGKRRINLEVPAEELAEWEAAKAEDESLDHWVRRSLNFLLNAEVEGELSVTLGRQRRLIRAVGTCVWCGKRLRTRDPRARYCSDLCRVTAWRHRRSTG